MGLSDKQFLDGFRTSAQVIAADRRAFTVEELRSALVYNLYGHDQATAKRIGRRAWLDGFDAGVRQAYGW